MTIESFHYLIGKVLEIGKKEETYSAPFVVTLSCPACAGNLVHQVQIFNGKRAEELLRSDVSPGDTLVAEVYLLRHMRPRAVGEGARFLSYLVQGGLLERVAPRPASTCHYLRGIYMGSAWSVRGGLDVLLREKRHDVVCDYVFNVAGEEERAFLGRRLLRGDDLLAATSNLTPVAVDDYGNGEFAGEGFQILALLSECLRPAALCDGERRRGPDRPQRPKPPEVTEEPGLPEVPEVPKVPKVPKVPEVPEVPKEPGAPKVTGRTWLPEAAGRTWLAGVAESPEAAGRAESSEAAGRTVTPEAAERTEASGAPSQTPA
ncbi:MAG: hypothetical protein LBW85_02565 [Deltaproteobacteria bacterium]|jgi:hypothetical protein|nr:hypothetical protein [Deltaproteobacteria bacterium]